MADCEDATHITRIAVLEEKIRSLKEAIGHQATEYARRLDELNHAHAQATSDKNKFITSELFYSKWDDMVKWRSEMDVWRSRVIGIAIGLGTVGGLVGGVIMRAL